MALESKRFRILNEGFVCEHCGAHVPPTAQTTPRNHCPFCLWSKHVDNNPGDRANECQGLLKPIGIYTHTKKSYIILQQCERCGARVRSKAILEDGNQPDVFERILELASNAIDEERPSAHTLSSAKKKKKKRKR